MLDRIDMHVEVAAVTARELLRGAPRNASQAESRMIAVTSGTRDTPLPALSTASDSASLRNRVQGARAIQQRRFEDHPRVRTNADMGLAVLDAFCQLDLESTALLQKAVES